MNWEHQIEQPVQVMNLRNRTGCFFQERFEIFFRGLLAMKADLIMELIRPVY